MNFQMLIPLFLGRTDVVHLTRKMPWPTDRRWDPRDGARVKRLALVRNSRCVGAKRNLKTHPKIASWNPNDPAALIGEKDLVLDAGSFGPKIEDKQVPGWYSLVSWY